MLNKALIIGRLGADPETRYTQGGDQITTFNLATDESYKDRDGKKVTKTEWHRIVSYKKLAEICAQYLTKGMLVYVEGKIQTREWEDKNGVKRKTTEIIAFTMDMLERKSEPIVQPEDGEVPF